MDRALLTEPLFNRTAIFRYLQKQIACLGAVTFSIAHPPSLSASREDKYRNEMKENAEILVLIFKLLYLLMERTAF